MAMAPALERQVVRVEQPLSQGGLDVSARGADSRDLDRMVGHGEAVLGAELVQPAFELAVAELDHPMAVGADEVVMVLVAAEAIADLAGMVHEGVDRASLAQERERAIDRREPDRLALRAKPCMDLLRAGVVGLRRQCVEHAEPLAGRRHGAASEERAMLGLRRLIHRARIAAHCER
jgi:hypothetical protein